MSSAIHPDKSGNLAGQPGSQPEPAKANPLRHKRPPAKPAATKPAAQPQPQPQPAPIILADREPDDRGRRAFASLLRQTPAWVVSILVHVIAILAMALFVTPPPEKPVAVAIVSSASESDEPVAEFADELPTEMPQPDATATEEPVPDQPVVVDPGVISDANDTTAAPLAVDASAFGDVSAPASNLLGSVTGVAGGKDLGGAYGKRGNPGQAAAKGGGGKHTEDAVDRALKWFIEHQLPDGGWSLDLKQCAKCNCANDHPGGPEFAKARSHLAKDRCAPTALALLPFLGRGFTHQEGPYKEQVGRGLRFLAELAVKGNGNAAKAGEGSCYSQGAATIALVEAYGMTRDDQLLLPAQAALDCLVTWQHPDSGGWDYSPFRADRPSLYTGDTSIGTWAIMALKSGQMAGLKVNSASFRKADKFLASLAEEGGAKYCYRPHELGKRFKLGVSTAGLLSRMYLGMKKEDPALQLGVQFVASQQERHMGNTYYAYYATQILHHVQGPAWDAWNAKMQATLLPAQATNGHEKGSWYEGLNNGPFDKHGGRLYVTSLCTMMLEVYYRHMAIYGDQSTAGGFKD
jgi:hypothetical protein